MKIYTKENIGEFIVDIGSHYETNRDLPELFYNDGTGAWIKEKYRDFPGAIESLNCGFQVKFELKANKTIKINAKVPAPINEMPEVGSEFWHITTDLSVMRRTYKGVNDYQSLTLFRVGNCFYGKDDAYAYRNAVFPRLKKGE